MGDADRAGQGSSYFRAFLRDLPDEIALARERGLPVELVVEAPLPAHAQRLMDTLGVPVHVVTPTATRSMSRAEKVELIGWARETFPELRDRDRAQLLEMSLSAYRNLLCDPDGSKQRERRDGYKGACVDCGAETKSDGTSQASRRCPDCAHADQLVWTPEAVVAAIQTFHARHGRTPSASEWLQSPEEGCPFTSSVLKAFGKWGDAIEAAGFPRPKPGGDYLIRERGSTVDYFVFRMNGSAELIGVTDARSVVEAIGKLADVEGRYGAITVTQIQVRDVKKQLAVVRPAVEEAPQE